MNRNIQAGFYLIEVLVSVFVVSIGVLCAARMQLAAMQTTQHSSHETFALQLAVDMANQIRADRNLLKVKDEQNPYLSTNFKAGQQTIAPSIRCINLKENCGAVDLAKFSIYEWQNKLKENLPNGRLQVCRDSEPWDSNAERYKWECNSAPNGGSPIVIKLGWREKKLNQSASGDSDKNYPPLIALIVGL